MECDCSDVYDLVLFLLVCLLDNDRCCRNNRFVIVAIRLWVNYFSTVIEVVIVTNTNDQFNKSLNVASIIMFSIYACCALAFTMMACHIKGSFSDKDEIFGISTKICKKSLWPSLLTATVLMLILDLFLFTFSVVYGTQGGQTLVDFTDAANGFSSCVFFLSIFDCLHAIVGLILLCVNRKRESSKIMPQTTLDSHNASWDNTMAQIDEMNKTNAELLAALQVYGNELRAGQSSRGKND